MRALTIENIQMGFRVCGIWPWDGTAMAVKIEPSEVFKCEANEVADVLTQLHVEDIQIDVMEPEDRDAQYFYIEVDMAEEYNGNE